MIIHMDDLFPFKGINRQLPGLWETVSDQIHASVRVLLVDDDQESIIATLALLSTDPRMEVIGLAQSGKDAIRMAEELQPDLVLMDLVMPGVNGLAATRLIKAQSLTTRVIILTQHDDLVYRLQAEAVNADGFISRSEIDKRLFPLIHSLGIVR